MREKRVFKKYKRVEKTLHAFTLAELLITITIVGVIAAMTLPTLLKKIDRTRYTNTYKKVESTLLNGLRRMKADDSFQGLKSTEEFVEQFSKAAKVVSVCPANNLSDCFPNKFEVLGAEFKLEDIKLSHNLGKNWADDTNVMGVVLLDGTSAILAYNTACDDNKDLGACAAFAFDMNGIKSTNRFLGNGLSDIGTLNAQFSKDPYIPESLSICDVVLEFNDDGTVSNKSEIEQQARNNSDLQACLRNSTDTIRDYQADIIDTANGGSGSGRSGRPCLAEGTLISLSDGTTKPIEDIDYNDSILVWNFDEGKYDNALPAWIKVEQTTDSYNLLTFSDGSQLKTINQHRIFNNEAGKFTYPMTDETPIGSTTLMSDGREVQLVSKEVIHEKVKFYNLITSKHFNCFANGVCTSNRFNNLYPIKDYKFVKDYRELVSYDKYSNVVSKDWYENLRLAEMPAELVDSDYLENMKRLDKKSLLINI